MNNKSNRDLSGKVLLVLGGTEASVEIVRAAHDMGVIVYVTDYSEDSPAKKYAEKSFLVSATDVDAVVSLCRDEKVDGVIAAYSDLLLPYAQEICEALQKPFWGNRDNIAVCTNKDRFKLACEKAGVPVVPWKKADRSSYTETDGLLFPVVIKPVDGSGGRGVCKCYSAEDYLDCCEKAFAFSKKGELIVESMMDLDHEYSVQYMLCGGKAYLSGMGDRYCVSVDDSTMPVCTGFGFPSEKLSLWQEKMTDCVQRFFHQNGMNDGFAFLQGFWNDDGFFVHEIGYRLNGGFSFKLVEHFSGYNQVRQLIRYSLTGSMEEEEIRKSDPAFNGYGLLISVVARPCGRAIDRILGLDQIRGLDGVVDVCLMDTAIEQVRDSKGTAEYIIYILCAKPTRKELADLVTTIRNTLQVLDSDGNSLLYDLLDLQ